MAGSEGVRAVWKWTKRISLGLLLVILCLLAPIGFNEIACRSAVQPNTYTAILPPEHHRPEARSLLTYPEWHIVHAYDDYAEVISKRDPHDYAYLRSIAGFWRSLCALSRAAGAHGGFDGDTKTMIYVIGVSFSLELLAKAAYEETLGRLATWVRGEGQSALDQLSAQQARGYARFLQQTPWYRWDFSGSNLDLLKGDRGSFRDAERSFALRTENRVKAVYADAIAAAVASVGFDELTLRMVVGGYDLALADVSYIADLPEGTVVETPRYRALTHVMVQMADAGVNFVEIAGNDDIMLTVLSDAPDFDRAIASLPRQGYGDYRHLVMLKVTELGARLRAYAAAGVQVEHIHDY